MTVVARLADLSSDHDMACIVELLDMYSRHEMGAGEPLQEDVRRRLPETLRQWTGCRVVLAFEGPQPVGIAVCFTGLSTFRARPLLNLHDIAVHPDARGKGVAGRLMQVAEDEARRMGCCKLTLEVRADNHSAKRSYAKFGFGDSQPPSETVFWSKPLD